MMLRGALLIDLKCVIVVQCELVRRDVVKRHPVATAPTSRVVTFAFICALMNRSYYMQQLLKHQPLVLIFILPKQ